MTMRWSAVAAVTLAGRAVANAHAALPIRKSRRPVAMTAPAMRPSVTPRRGATGARSSPGALVLLLVVAEGLQQPTEDLGGGLEHRLELGLVDLLDVFAKMVADLLQGPLHLLGMMTRVAIVGACHAAPPCCRVNGRSVGSVPDDEPMGRVRERQ